MFLFLLTLSLYPLAALIALGLIPGDAKNALLLGLSLQRLLLMLIALVGFLATAIPAVLLKYRPAVWQRQLAPLGRRLLYSRWMAGLAVLLALQGLIAVFLPAYWFGTGHAYYDRLRPILLWLGAAGFQITLAVQLNRHSWNGAAFWRELKSLHPLWSITAVAFTAMALLWLLAAWTGWGARPDILWNEAAPPILAVQLASSLLAAVLVGALLRRIEPARRRRAEWAVAFALWALAAFIWIQEPMPRSYFAPGPYPPNDVYYPYSDAASYDLTAQYVMLGQPLDLTAPNEKPVYGAFLVMLHLLGGQSYDLVTLFQVLFLALFPVVLFRLGRHFQLEAGLLVALLAIFKERNAISATLSIRVSHSRLLLTEFPTALIVAIICWLLVEYLASPDRRRLLPLAIGGWLGLGAMLRLNLLALTPAILLLVLAAFWRRKRAAWLFGLVLLCALALPMIPWSAATTARWGQPAWVLKLKMVLDSRYAPEPSAPLPTADPGLQPTPGATLQPSPEVTLPPTSGVVPPSQPAAMIPPETAPLPQSTSTAPVETTPTPDNSPDPGSGSLSQQSEICAGKQGLAEILCFAPAHWAHNNLMALLLLPHTPSWEDLAHTLQRIYWLDIRSWNGRLPVSEALLLTANLLLIALGIGYAWQRRRWAGLAPLALMQIYFAANALGRTSGGRYLTPVDWTVYFYAALGLGLMLSWLSQLLGRPVAAVADREVLPQAPAAARFPWHRAVWVLLAFLIPALALPFVHRAFPAQVSTLAETALLEEVAAAGVLTKMDVTDQQLSAFAASPEGVLLAGRGFYPRFYNHNQGEPASQATPQFSERPYPRLIFTLLTGQQPQVIELPLNTSPGALPDAARWIVLGCQNPASQRVDAVALVLMSDPPRLILRSPGAALSCPVSEPVCDDNRNCR